VERLTSSDLAMLWPDDHGWPQDIGVIAILDGRSLLDSSGAFRIEALRDHVEGRLARLPRFRQLLHRTPFGLGSPLWVDAETVDLTEHIQLRPLDPPGGESQLLHACEELRRIPFDRARPLWRMWCLTGLPDQKVGLYIRLHHSVADGVAGVGVLAALVDTDPDSPPPPLTLWSPAPPPSTFDMVRDNVSRRLRRLASALSSLAHPVRTSRRLWIQCRVIVQMLNEGIAPKTSLNRRVGPHRRMAVIRGDLDTFREIAHRHQGKVNDVLLAVLTGGLRDLLTSRGEPVADLVLRTMIPVSHHGEHADQSLANYDGGMLVPIPLAETDPARKLQSITTETAMRKQRPQPIMGSGLLSSTLLQKLVLKLIPHQRLGNLSVSNVPGPPMPLYLAGAQLLELFPIVPITGNITLGVGALSYAGQFNLTVVADDEACPDLDVFISGIQRSLADLTEPVATSQRHA